MALFRPGKRRQYIVDPSFQFKYLITWLVMFLAFLVFVIGGLVLGLKLMHTSPTYGLKEISFILKVDAVFIILVTVTMGIYILLLSHRIAGPAYRLQKSIQRIISGDYDFSVSLRKRDYLKHVADDLNELLTLLRENNGTLNGILEDFRSLKTHLGQSNIPSEVKDLLGKVKEGILKVLPKR